MERGEIQKLNKEVPTKCKIDGCAHGGVTNGKGVISFPRGYCSIHYRRFMRSGDPLFMEIAMNEGRKKDPLYSIYKGMRSRCNSKSSVGYNNYGGRGIKVCNGWSGINGFVVWKNDMGGRPSKKHSIDRIDVNGNYSCGHCEECVEMGWDANCRWATVHTQSANKRTNNKCPGVYFDKKAGKWIARLQIDNEEVLHKGFREYNDAVDARIQAEIDFLGGRVNCENSSN